eukprot:TRINITY_DN51324_c0_g1_i1.p1 TRINITY_DN51324_c0_g1~~TRINITY_DN51324_c0_g1_i1.p1  ORF type:complete len:700 (+),score=99.45 TRINITY_DN51324_c0_g1_i1:52-2151(+)
MESQRKEAAQYMCFGLFAGIVLSLLAGGLTRAGAGVQRICVLSEERGASNSSSAEGGASDAMLQEQERSQKERLSSDAARKIVANLSSPAGHLVQALEWERKHSAQLELDLSRLRVNLSAAKEELSHAVLQGRNQNERLSSDAARQVVANLSSPAGHLVQALEWERKYSAMLELDNSKLRANLSFETASANDLRAAKNTSCAGAKTRPKKNKTATTDDVILANWPCSSKGCCKMWTRIPQTKGAGFQNLRLDGITQPRNISDKYKVYRCLDGESNMHVTIRVVKLRDCHENESNFIFNGKYEQLVKNDYGPEEFSLILEGPEMLALQNEAVYQGRCRYEMSARLSIPGSYRVNLVWWRENYVGFREVQREASPHKWPASRFKGWPVSHYDDPIGHEVFLTLGAPSSRSTSEALAAAIEGQGLPPCSLTAPRHSPRGRWVYNRSDFDKIFLANPKSFQMTSGTTVSIRVDPARYVWRPFDCRMYDFDRQSATTCLGGKKVQLLGDSHFRRFTSAIVALACSQPRFESRGTLQKGPCNGTEGLDFRQEDMYPWLYAKLSNFNFVILNTGQHASDAAHKMRFDEFEQTLIAKMTKALQTQRSTTSKASPALTIWHEINAIRMRDDGYVRSKEDWRTPSRLRLFNRIATEKMLQLGYPVIPTFEQTSALILHNLDPAHYGNDLLMPSSVQYLLNLICPLYSGR